MKERERMGRWRGERSWTGQVRGRWGDEEEVKWMEKGILGVRRSETRGWGQPVSAGEGERTEQTVKK